MGLMEIQKKYAQGEFGKEEEQKKNGKKVNLRTIQEEYERRELAEQ